MHYRNLLTPFLLLPALVLAAEAPLYIEADRATLDDRSGIAIYQHNVQIRHADRYLEADKVTLQRRNGDLDTLIAEGTPARFRHRPQRGEPIEAEALRIEYFADGERVLLIGEARLIRNGDRFSGDRIDYHIDSEVVRAEGESGRVRAVIQPRSDQGDGTP